MSDRTASQRQARRRERERDGVVVLHVAVKIDALVAKLLAADYLPLEQSRNRAAVTAAVSALLDDLELENSRHA